MKQRKMFKSVFLSLLMVLCMVCICSAREQTNEQKAPDKQALETIKGTIDYNESMGGFFIKGVEPGGEFFIVNQDNKILKQLKKSGKTVVIEGYTGEGGAEFFKIERINGKKYPSAKINSNKSMAKEN